MGAALSKVSLLQDEKLKRVLTEIGSWRMTEGGWFESQKMKSGSSFGFLYGLYVPFVKLKVKSKKLVVSWLDCAVIVSPRLLKTCISSFLVLSLSLPHFFVFLAPQDRHRDKDLGRCQIYL